MIKKKLKILILSLTFGIIISLNLSLSNSRMLKQGTGWVSMDPNPAPSARSNLQIVYDTESDRMIIFGGVKKATTQERYNDTWVYDYNTNIWVNKTPIVSPGRRNGHSMAYDSESDRCILFGGLKTYYDPPTSVEGWNDTWAYDYNSNTWVEMNPEECPSTRMCAAMKYDSESDRMVLFGGWSEDRMDIGETWIYNFNNNSWKMLTPEPAPSGRYRPAMAYDSESDRMILFGGMSEITAVRDTWAYDYNSNTWTNMNPSTAPPARLLAAMVYDKSVDRIIFFGGTNVAKTFFYTDTWAYDYNSNTWNELTHTTHPSGRCYIDMAYDEESNRSILFGGETDSNIRSDETWVYESTMITTQATSNIEIILTVIGLILYTREKQKYSKSLN
ncbi:MAG: Kelch repeat-containing protein [Promethearchaeota archaeon]